MERHDEAHRDGADESGIEDRRRRVVMRAALARHDLIEPVAARRAEHKEGRPVVRRGLRPDDYDGQRLVAIQIQALRSSCSTP